MADEIDAIIDPAPEPEAPAPETPPAPTGITQEQVEALLSEQREKMEQSFTQKYNELARNITSAPSGGAPESGGDPQDFWSDPRAAVRKELEGYVAKTLAPVAGNFAGTLTTITIDNFKARKSTDPLFNGVEKVFDDKIGKLNKQWLASLAPQDLASALAEAWDASVGGYVQAERKRRAATPKPANLGGGASGGGGTNKTGAEQLQELDPISYRWAVQGGMTDEQMLETVKELKADKAAQEDDD